MGGLSTPVVGAIFLVATAATWFAGLYLADSTDVLDDRFHLGEAIGGLIRVHAELVPEGVRVSVADNGAGIPVDALERIFELFQRGPVRADGQSAGIGLAVVRRLVGLHGGSVSAASDGPGFGAEFTVLLPAEFSS